jgi:hypothetical protein
MRVKGSRVTLLGLALFNIDHSCAWGLRHLFPTCRRNPIPEMYFPSGVQPVAFQPEYAVSLALAVPA